MMNYRKAEPDKAAVRAREEEGEEEVSGGGKGYSVCVCVCMGGRRSNGADWRQRRD